MKMLNCLVIYSKKPFQFQMILTRNFDSKLKNEILREKSKILFNNEDFQPFSIDDLNKEIKKLKKLSAVGPDGIHNLMIINSTIEFNFKIILSISRKGIHNTRLGNSKCNHDSKKQVKSENPKDDRPISVTRCLGELMEKLICNRLNANT